MLVGTQATLSCVGRSAARSSDVQTVSVKSFDVVNDRGEVVIHLGVRTSGAGGFWIADEKGARVLELNQNERGGLITVLDRAGRDAGTLGLDADGQISVEPTGKRR